MKKTKNLMSKTRNLLLVFGIIFSQMSFPLNVLADEITNDNEVIEAEEQTKENTIDGNQQEENNNNKKTRELITPPEPKEVVEFLDEKIEGEEENFYIIKNKLNTALTIKQLKDSRENVVSVFDESNNEILDENQLVKSNYKATITVETPTTKDYTIIILGDYNSDGLITTADKEELLNLLKSDLTEDYINQNINSLDLNKDGIFDILDVTHPIFNLGIWENQKTVIDELKNYMTSNEEVYVGEVIEVNYYIEGFETDKLSAFQGILEYDNTLLELTNLEIAGINHDIKELTDNKLIYLLDNYASNGCMIKLTFKALAKGETSISINNIIASIEGVAANIVNEENADSEQNSVSTNLNIINPTGGNPAPEEPVEESTETITPTNQVSTVTPVVLKPLLATPINHTIVEYVSLSNDNYIKSLIIKGYEIDFNKDTLTYSIKVKNDVTSLEMTVILNNDNATYYVEGNKDFKVGKNIVSIIVTSEDGSTKAYTINVEKEKKQTILENQTNKNEEPSTSKKIIIILIILVIIGLIYVIFKDDEEDEIEVQNTKKEDNKKTNNVSNQKASKSTNKEKTTKTNQNQVKKGSKK